MWGARLVLPVTWMSTTDHFSSPSPVTNAELPAPHSMLLHGTRIATYTVSFVGKTYTLFEVRSIRVDDMCSLFLDKSSNFSLSFRAQLGVTRHPTYCRSGIARPIFLGRFFFLFLTGRRPPDTASALSCWSLCFCELKPNVRTVWRVSLSRLSVLSVLIVKWIHV